MALAVATLHDDLARRLEQARACVRPVRSGSISKVLGLRFDVEGLDLPIGASVRLAESGLDLSGAALKIASLTERTLAEILDAVKR